MVIDRLIEHRLRDDLSQAIKAVLEKAQSQGHMPEIGPAAAASMADACVAMLLALDDTQDQMRRDGLLSEEE
jgi:transposase